MASLAEALYARVVRPLLFRLEPETAHRLVLALAAGLPSLAPRDDPPALARKVWDIAFSNPIGLAAGMDKDLRAGCAWQALGFGFAEMGTITPRPQPGNPRPRVWRLPEHRAIVNSLGFPGLGMENAARRMARLRSRGVRIPLGLNFGPNRDTPPEKVADDCAALVMRLAPMADFVVINLSSPNMPGLRAWQAPDQMRRLFVSVLAKMLGVTQSGPAGRRKPPVLVKIAPDLDSSQIGEICEVAGELGLDGIVATNTTVAREEVGVTSGLGGGLSGQPLKLRARSVIRELFRHTRGALPIIGVGGVATADDAYEHIRAGASLVELYTALVYEGPFLVRAVKRGLVELLKRDGLGSVADAVGISAG